MCSSVVKRMLHLQTFVETRNTSFNILLGLGLVLGGWILQVIGPAADEGFKTFIVEDFGILLN